VRVANKIAVVSGAAAGIGLAIAERLAEEGATVFGGDLAYKEAGKSDSGILTRPLDVADLASWQVLAAEVAEAGGADILINNAGMVGSYEPITDIALQDWHAIIGVNQNGVFYGMRTFIPQMQGKGGGSIVNISSIWGLVGAIGVSAYQASKGAVTVMTKNAAMSYAADGIRVNSVHPGLIATPMIAAQDARDEAISNGLIEATPLRRIGQPREVANAVLFLASDEASYTTGSQLMVDGGFTTA
jgi:NAD(P)-dependent dehydrogenase (short-subunit alcohol dehydrogenase family)